MKTNINLIPKFDFDKKPLGRFLTWALTYGRYIIIGTEIIVLMAFFSRFKFDRELTDLHDLVGQKETIVAASSGLEEDVRSLTLRLNEIKNLEGKNVYASQILEILEGSLPPDVILRELSFDQNKLTLEGNALSTSGFSSFLNNLSSSKKFSQVNLEEVSRGRSEIGTKFKLSCYLKGNL